MFSTTSFSRWLHASLVIVSLLITTTELLSQEMLVGTTTQGGEYGMGAIFKTNVDGTDPEILYSFETPYPGSGPQQTKLVESADGKLYGVTSGGGKFGKGVIFAYDPINNTYSRKFDFDGENGANPYGSLVLAPNGKLYGMTSVGGSNGLGVLFEIDPATGSFLKKFDFNSTDGGAPFGTLLSTPDGKLWGLTYYGGANNQGVLFRFDPENNDYLRKYDFNPADGSSPYGSLLLMPSGNFYGMTTSGGSNDKGSIFEYDTTANITTKKFDFSGTADGATPRGDLIHGNDGKLYGMTLNGGTADKGVIFQFDPSNGEFVKKIDFDGGADGASPYGSLFRASNGKLYGVTESGASGYGTFFEYVTSTNTLSTLVTYNGLRAGNGNFSRTTLMQASNGKLYGMTWGGGISLRGNLFEYDPVSGEYKVKFSFSEGVGGYYPPGPLVQALNGKLYGIALEGGNANSGALFEFDITHGIYTKKIEFNPELGVNSYGRMLLASDGKLYGTTSILGPQGSGVLFEYDPSAGTLTRKQEFSATTGAPKGGLIQVPDGKIYGVTETGGANGKGTIFEFDPVLNTMTTKIDFESTDKGEAPTGTLLYDEGKLYGLTAYGGADNLGVLFEYDITSGTFTKKADFDGTTKGANPYGSLVKSSHSKMYGTTFSGGANNAGVLFEYDPATGDLNKKIDHSGAQPEGYRFFGNLVESSNDKLYGTTYSGGSDNLGILFEYDVTNNGFVKKVDFTGANGAHPYDRSALLYVSMQEQTITFNELSEKTYGEESFVLNATATSALEVTYSSSNPEVASIEGSIVTIHSAGTTEITAWQTGNMNFHPAEVTRVLTVNKADQLITFNTLPGKTFNDENFQLHAESNAGLEITYTSSDPEVASVTGNVVTITGAGSTTITATQAGNDNYHPAEAVAQILVVNKADQIINFSSLTAKDSDEEPFQLEATASSGLEIAYSSSDPGVATIAGYTVTITGAGTTEITASQAGNDNYNEAESVAQTLVVNLVTALERSVHSIRVYPNPANSEIIIDPGNEPFADPVELIFNDMLGRTSVLPTEPVFQNGTYRCTTETLKDGVYLLRLPGRNEVRKIAVAH